MDEKKGWLSNMVTRRATVMTPLLILNAILLFFGTAMYFKSGTLFLLIIWIPVLVYTIYRHEKWSNKAPWLLAPQKVAMHGMNLFGDSTKSMSEDVIDLQPVQNPQSLAIKSKGSKK